MRTAVVGAGPTGLYTAIALARRGHQVTVIDRDPGPPDTGRWPRRGVMQFHHPHFFHQQVLAALQAEMPEVVDALVAAGAVPATLPDQPDRVAGLRCRREVFERVLRAAAAAEPGVQLHTGQAQAVLAVRRRVVGVRADRHTVDADLVIDASGRAGRFTRAWRGPAEGGACGSDYLFRQYQLRPDAADGPINAPFGIVASYPGYQVIVIVHDNRTLSAMISRASGDRQLAALRHRSAFDAAAAAIPMLAAWTDPAQSQPLTPVLPGGRLYNRYQGQLDRTGRSALDGLIFVGDAVCITNPGPGRGVATSLLQAWHLVGLLGGYHRDFISCALAFDHWCTQHIKPWFADQVYADTQLQRRWAGHDVDLTRPLPSDLIVAAAAADPQLMTVVRPYLAMQALPASLDAVQARARALYATGWRPPLAAGPTWDQLTDLIT